MLMVPMVVVCGKILSWLVDWVIGGWCLLGHVECCGWWAGVGLCKYFSLEVVS